MIDFNLTKIKLYNFVCYKDETIEFNNASKDKNIFLFKMRNGTGKTTLFHAIKWGIYGEKNIRFYKDSQEVFVEDFLNDRVKENFFYVEIWFKYGENRYTLKRTFNVDSKKKESSIELIKNEREELICDEAQERLEFIIPKNFSDFFMFDGEQLSRFMSAQKELHFRESIEQLLGLRQLRLLKEDLTELQKESERELTKLNSDDSKVESKNKLINLLNREIDSFEVQIENYIKKIKNNEDFIKEYEVKQEGYASQLKIQEELSQLKEKREKISNELVRIKQKLIDNSKRLFTVFINSDLDKYIKENNKRLKELEEVCGLTEKQAQSHAGKEDILKKCVPKCEVCGHQLTTEEKEKVEKELNEIKKKLILFQENKKESDGLKNENTLFEQFTSKKNDIDYVACFDDLAEILQKYKDINSKLNKLAKETQNKRFGDYGEISRRIQRLRDENNDLQNKIKLINAKKEAKFEEKKNIILDIKKLGHDNKLISSTSNKFSFISKLIESLDKALEEGKERKRQQIIKESNRLFLEITNKSDEYKSIEFEDEKSYSFVIRANDDRVVKNPSKGEKQVLAMSFLLGLSQYTGRSNVIVMDTPVTSLDDIHATGIGNALSKLNNQVIFLAQPQELKGEIYNSIKKAVAKEYEGKRKDYQTYIE